jgi:hypothetical protein
MSAAVIQQVGSEGSTDVKQSLEQPNVSSNTTLNSPFEGYSPRPMSYYTNWQSWSPHTKTIAPLLAINTAVWGAWQLAVRTLISVQVSLTLSDASTFVGLSAA